MNSFKEIQFIGLFVWFLTRIYTNSTQECFDDGNEFCIDENDILSVDLLPGSFLFADQQVNDNTTKGRNVPEDASIDGSIHDALNEMEYHR